MLANTQSLLPFIFMSNLGAAAPPPATYRHLDNAGDIIAAAFVSVSRHDEDGSILSSEPTFLQTIAEMRTANREVVAC